MPDAMSGGAAAHPSVGGAHRVSCSAVVVVGRCRRGRAATSTCRPPPRCARRGGRSARDGRCGRCRARDRCASRTPTTIVPMLSIVGATWAVNRTAGDTGRPSVAVSWAVTTTVAVGAGVQRDADDRLALRARPTTGSTSPTSRHALRGVDVEQHGRGDGEVVAHDDRQRRLSAADDVDVADLARCDRPVVRASTSATTDDTRSSRRAGCDAPRDGQRRERPRRRRRRAAIAGSLVTLGERDGAAPGRRRARARCVGASSSGFVGARGQRAARAGASVRRASVRRGGQAHPRGVVRSAVDAARRRSPRSGSQSRPGGDQQVRLVVSVSRVMTASSARARCAVVAVVARGVDAWSGR